MKKLTIKALLMAGIIAFSANVFADPITTPSIVKSGGTLNVAGNSEIILRAKGGNLQVDKGAVMNMPLGTVR